MGSGSCVLGYEFALFANGYLAVVAEEGASVKEYMLCHLRELFEDMEVHGWKVVRSTKPPGSSS